MSDSTITTPTMLPILEVSARTGLSYDFIRKLCLNGKIAHVRAGKKYLVNYDRFVDYLNTEGRTGDE